MGSASSKPPKAAAGAAARIYPTRTPPSTHRAPVVRTPTSSTTTTTTAQVNHVRKTAIDPDTFDPGLASRLTTLGAVQPNPHYSASSTSTLDPRRRDHPDMMTSPPPNMFPDPRDNPALRVLEARSRIADEAEGELAKVGRRGFAGRKYVDAGVVQLALMRKSRGDTDERIEEGLGIQKGRLSVLGRGVVDTV